MRSSYMLAVAAVVLLTCSIGSWAQSTQDDPARMASRRIRGGAKVFITTLDNGFDIYLAAAIEKKKVPLLVVSSKEKADYEISAISESDKAGWAKMLFMNSMQSSEHASMKVTDLQTGEIVYGYAVEKGNSARGKQSAAEACAKHLKEKIESQK